MNYRWTRPSCPSPLWISNVVLPASLGGNIVCVSVGVGQRQCVCVLSRKKAVRQIKKDAIMMSRVVITFLPLNGGRGRVGRGVGEASCDVITTCHDPVSSQLTLVCLRNTTHPFILTYFDWWTTRWNIWHFVLKNPEKWMTKSYIVLQHIQFCGSSYSTLWWWVKMWLHDLFPWKASFIKLSM